MAANRKKRLRAALRTLVPLVPFEDAQEIVDRASRPKFGELRADQAIYLSAVSHIRHRFTEYETLLHEGYSRDTAREMVAAEIDTVLSDWGGGASLIERAGDPEDRDP